MYDIQTIKAMNEHRTTVYEKEGREWINQNIGLVIDQLDSLGFIVVKKLNRTWQE